MREFKLGKKCIIDKSWNFKSADTKIYTHCFHIYPAMMIPQIVDRLLKLYGKNAKLLFDPYCGTGTSLVEAKLNNINSIGTDLNPLARLITKAKTTIIDLQTLDTYIKDFDNYILPLLPILQIKKLDIEIPKFKNIDYWFDKKVQENLAIIKQYIYAIEDVNISNFFKVVFSETIRETSWTRNGEFKLYRMNAKQMEKFNPDVFKTMRIKLIRNRDGLEAFIEAKKGNAFAQIMDFNTIFPIPNNILSSESVDIVITSPPYGDSRTTVAYGQFSRLANQWLDIENANQIDNILMGGKRKKEKIIFNNKLLNEIIEQIADKDIKRVKDVISFYDDYKKSITNISKVIKKDGYVCYVIGNRKVKGIILPTDKITKQFFEIEKFKHIKTIIRDIPNKRMPSKNSPSNIIGKLDTTINKEYIVILQKC